jgi:hypothetical protein
MLFPPEALTLGLEYLISFAGLKISPEIISLGVELEDLVDAELAEADIVLVADWFVCLTTCCTMLYTLLVHSEINFPFGKIDTFWHNNS